MKNISKRYPIVGFMLPHINSKNTLDLEGRIRNRWRCWFSFYNIWFHMLDKLLYFVFRTSKDTRSLLLIIMPRIFALQNMQICIIQTLYICIHHSRSNNWSTYKYLLRNTEGYEKKEVQTQTGYVDIKKLCIHSKFEISCCVASFLRGWWSIHIRWYSEIKA